MELEEQIVMEVLRKIVDLNKRKLSVAYDIEVLTGELCALSAEIGALQALLKPVEPSPN